VKGTSAFAEASADEGDWAPTALGAGHKKAPESDELRAQFELCISSEISYMIRRVKPKPSLALNA
jgi:hypothetical protein